MPFIKEILNRRIPHILGSYIVAATSLVLFIDWLAARYEFPEYYTTIALFGIISITGIKIKIEEVYDSTAIGRVYSSKDPNIKLKVGDMVIY